MNFLDAIIIISIGYNLFIGLRKGLIGICFDLIGMILGLFLAVSFYHAFALTIQKMTMIPLPFAFVIAFGLIWAGLFFSFAFIGRTVGRGFAVSFLGPFNMIFGAAIGALKGFFFLLPALIPMMYFQADAIKTSALMAPLKPVVTYIMDTYIPKAVMPNFEFPVQKNTKNK